MKKIVLHIVIFLLITAGAAAQKAPSGENPSKKGNDSTMVVKKQSADINSANIKNDTSKIMRGKGKGHMYGRKRKDKFIDKDGDGINDNRCKGMGLCKGRKGRRHGKK